MATGYWHHGQRGQRVAERQAGWPASTNEIRAAKLELFNLTSMHDGMVGRMQGRLKLQGGCR